MKGRLAPAGIRRKTSMHDLATQVHIEVRFWEQWKEHEPFLLALCRQWARGSELDARELLSAGMLHAFEGVNGLKDEIGNHRAWFAKVLRNYCIDHQRKQSRHPQIKVDPEVLVPIIDQQLRGQQVSVEGTFIREERYQHLLGRVDGLPKRLREAMVLRACQDLSYQEIASQLHISSENARKRVELARKKLRSNARIEKQGLGRHKSEKTEVEAILATSRTEVDSNHLALPIMIQSEGLRFEIPVFLQRKPIRVAQKEATLRKYIEKHPGGWKKELEYGLLCWSMGKAKQSLQLLKRTFYKHASIHQVVLTYLSLLAAVKDWKALQMACKWLLREGLMKPETQQYGIVAGFIAFANRDDAAVLMHWKKVKEGRLFGFKCEALLKMQKRGAAIKMAKAWNAIHPMQREPYFYLAALETDFDIALEYAGIALRRFVDDPYAKGLYLLIALRNGFGLASQAELLAGIKALAPNSWLFAVCQWAIFEKNAAIGNCFLKVWLRLNAGFETPSFVASNSPFNEKLTSVIHSLVFP